MYLCTSYCDSLVLKLAMVMSDGSDAEHECLMFNVGPLEVCNTVTCNV